MAKKYDSGKAYADIKQLITARDYAERFLEPRGNNRYVCPCCDSGNGPNHTAAMYINGANGDRWHCFSCNHGGDVFDLAAAHLGTNHKQLVLEELARLVGYDLEPTRGGEDNGYKQREPMKPKPYVSREPDISPEELERNQKKEARTVYALRRYIEDAEAVEYLESRGISVEKAKEWGLGFNQYTHRILIPWKGCNYYHIDRAVNDQPVKYLKPSWKKLGPEPLYNGEALRTSDVVFVVEGPLDALAVADMGFEAIALNTSGSARAADRLAAEKPSAKIVLLLDDDAERADGRNPGKEGRNEMAARLSELGMRGCVCKALERLGVNDPFDAWANCPDKFKAELQATHDFMAAWNPEKKTLEHAKSKAPVERAVKQEQTEPREEKPTPVEEKGKRAVEQPRVEKVETGVEQTRPGKEEVQRETKREGVAVRSPRGFKTAQKPQRRNAVVEKVTPDSDMAAIKRSAAARTELNSSTPTRPPGKP